MATSAATIFLNEQGKEIAVMINHYDGNPDAHGNDLIEWAAGGKIVNGIPLGYNSGRLWNGMSCLAADCIASFKSGPGAVYLEPAGTRGADYTYTLSCFEGNLWLRVTDWDNGHVYYEGYVEKFKGWK